MHWDNKFYSLMPPFLLGGLLLIYVSPSVFRPYIILIVPLILWTVYHIWKKSDQNKTYRK